MPTNQKRIPTAIALLTLIALMVGAVFITSQIQNRQSLESSAAVPGTPENVGIANVTSKSVSVYWTSQEEVPGAVLFGTTPSLGGSVAFDERDGGSGKSGQFTTHLVRLVNLKPETRYYFKISSGSSVYGNTESDGAPFEVTTFKDLSSQSFIEPLYGKFVDETGVGQKGVLVRWTSPNTSPIVVLTKSDGSYVLPLSMVRTLDGTKSLSLPVGTAETIEFLDQSGSIGTLSCTTGKDVPLPEVKVGEAAVCLGQSVTKSTDSAVGTGRFNPPVQKLDDLMVNLADGETTVTPLPIFSGTAPAGQLLRIKVTGKNSYSGTLKTSADGSWSWAPPANLSAGENTLTVTVMSGSKSQAEITRKFFAPGNDKILGLSVGTPSATFEHFDCVNNACVKVAGAGSDTCSVDDDCEPVPEPPADPSPPPPPVEPTPPATGAVENTLFALTWGVLFITLGVGTIFFLTK